VQKISPPPGFDLRTAQPIASHYTNYAIPVLHTIDTRKNVQLHRPIANSASHQKGVYYASIKIFYKIEASTAELGKDKKLFISALKKFFNCLILLFHYKIFILSTGTKY
jgi:hypothetical protein